MKSNKKKKKNPKKKPRKKILEISLPELKAKLRGSEDHLMGYLTTLNKEGSHTQGVAFDTCNLIFSWN